VVVVAVKDNAVIVSVWLCACVAE